MGSLGAGPKVGDLRHCTEGMFPILRAASVSDIRSQILL